MINGKVSEVLSMYLEAR